MKVKKTNIFAILITVFWFGFANAQTKIDYGSNNGKYVTVKNIKIYYEEYGAGIPLLLLHGGLVTLNSFASVIPDLSKHFHVIAIDLPGEGRSEKGDSLSFPLLESCISQFIDQLKFDSVYVFGYSMGGIISMHLAVSRPDKVKMTIVESSLTKLSEFVPSSSQFLSNISPEIIEANLDFWLDDHLNKTPQKDKWKNFIADFRKLWTIDTIYISPHRLQQIKTSVLVIQSDKDIMKPEVGLRMHNLIKESQFCVLPNSTHFVLWERPDLVSKTVLDYFLKTKPTGAFGK